MHRSPRAVDVVVIGAGHAGLAMSYELSRRSIDHVILERGVVANSWRRDRWDSLKLLTPNWQTRLPGYVRRSEDPDDFMTAAQVAEFIEEYAIVIHAPIKEGTTVTAVTPTDSGYLVATDQGEWTARAVVMANGANSIARVPSFAQGLPSSIEQWTAKEYKNPSQIDTWKVLVVGASATGLQLADELQRAGRDVTLAVGEHIRMPRSYRGRDIQWWIDALGIANERYDAMEDIERARNIPSPQLVGTSERSTLDLNSLTDRGVEIVGRVVKVDGSKVQFSGSLPNHCAMADIKLRRLLARADAWIRNSDAGGLYPEGEPPQPTRVAAEPRLSLDLNREKFGAVIWATGFRPDFSWLNVPALDRKGRLRHDGGVVDAPGMYVVGLNFLRRRKSSLIHGAADDVHDLSEHLERFLRRSRVVPRLKTLAVS